jgi:hypothetical protein
VEERWKCRTEDEGKLEVEVTETQSHLEYRLRVGIVDRNTVSVLDHPDAAKI